MDWQGQKLAEELMQYMLIGSALVSFASGYFLVSFRLMLIVYAAGVLLTVLVTVPNWPFYNRHSLKWLDSKTAEAATTRPAKARQTPAVLKKSSKGGSRK